MIRSSLVLVLCSLGVIDGAGRPNILFAISDDQSWMHASAYGDKGTRTPAFDRIAEEGILFTHAYASCPSCMPSRTSILTGRNMWETGPGGNLMGTLKADYAIFSLLLEQSGYQLGATGKTWGPGKLEGFTPAVGKTLPLRSYSSIQTEAILGESFHRRTLKERRPGMSNLDYAANFEDFLAERDKDKPFFFWYGSNEPHQGFEEGAWKKAGKNLADALVPGSLPDDPVVRGEFLDYALEIEHFDRHLGRMIELLVRENLLESTLIVVTSDHGNPMPRSKCNLYDSGTRVPLAIRFAGPAKKGATRRDLVNLIDLAPTFLTAAGVEIPEEMSGHPLQSLPETGAAVSRGFVVTGFERHIICRRDGVGYPARCIRTDSFAYIRNYEPDRWPAGDPDFVSSHQGFLGDCDRGATKEFLMNNSSETRIAPYYRLSFGRRPPEELYDMKRDPHQLRNLAEEEKFAEVKSSLRQKMEDYLRATGDPRMQGQSPWDDYDFTDKRIFGNPRWREEGLALPSVIIEDPDTDGDGLADGRELAFGSDPLDAASLPVDPVVQPSFVPINAQESGVYGPVFTTPGVDYQENKYNGGVIANGQSLNNYNVHVSGSPAPDSSVTAVQPWTSHGDGGNFSTRNSPFVDGGGDNFTVRYNGYLDMRGYDAGDYTIHLQSDDTNYFVMDTVDGTVIVDDPSCCNEITQSFTISIPGLFPFDNVFGEQGGGEWTDVAISGPGITGIVALGDTENGSPPVYIIGSGVEAPEERLVNVFFDENGAGNITLENLTPGETYHVQGSFDGVNFVALAGSEFVTPDADVTVGPLVLPFTTADQPFLLVKVYKGPIE